MAVEVGQVYRDKDKRMSSGQRYLIVREAGSARSKLAPCSYDGTAFSWRDYEHTTWISNRNLEKRFELVQFV